MGMKLRVGVIGLGNGWEQRYLTALRALADRLDIRAVFEPVHCRAEAVLSHWGARRFDSFQLTCRNRRIDAVIVLDTYWYGPLPVLAACDAGKAVFLGRNVRLTLEDWEVVRGRVRESGVAFMAELPRRHAPATVRLKELIATRLGAPRLVFCYDRIPLQNKAGLQTRSEERDFPSHAAELVDWCSFVMGRVATRVTGHIGRVPAGDDSLYFGLTIDFAEPGAAQSGPLAVIDCAHSRWNSWRESLSYRPPPALKVVCERGVAFLDLPSTLVWFDEVGQHMEPLGQELSVTESMLMLFYRQVTSLVRRMGDAEDLCRATRVVAEAQRSDAEGRRIELPPPGA